MSTLSVANLVNVTAINLANTITIANSISVGNSSVNSTINSTSGIFANNITVANSLSYDGTTLLLSGTGKRISGDFSNATATSRVSFQSNVTDGSTIVQSIPNGNGVNSGYYAWNSSDTSNSGVLLVTCSNTGGVSFNSFRTGAANYQPIYFNTGGSTSLTILTNGNVGVGTSSPDHKLSVSGSLFISNVGIFSYLDSIPTLSTESAFLGSDQDFRIKTTGGNISHLMIKGGTGNIGIGNSTPQSKLTVAGSGHFYGITLSNTAGVDVGFNTNYGFVTSGNRGSSTLNRLDFEGSSFKWLFGFGTSQQMELNTNGLGLGTSPAYKYDVYSSSVGDCTARFKASDGGSELILDSTNGYTALRIFNSGTEKFRIGQVASTSNMGIYDNVNGAWRMYLLANGNIGIGTTGPGSSKLYVSSNNNTSSHGAAGRFVDTSSGSGNFVPFSFENDRGNHSFGIVARFRVNTNDSDRPSIQFSSNFNDNRWNVGYCTGSDDNFRISQNMAFRNDGVTTDNWGTERFKIDTSGRVTTVTQPAFFARAGTARFNQTGVLTFNSVAQNIGNHYDGTNTFTAPVAGWYIFSVQVYKEDSKEGQIYLEINGGSSIEMYRMVGSATATLGHCAASTAAVHYLNANDYVRIYAAITIHQNASLSYFAGRLLG